MTEISLAAADKGHVTCRRGHKDHVDGAVNAVNLQLSEIRFLEETYQPRSDGDYGAKHAANERR